MANVSTYDMDTETTSEENCGTLYQITVVLKTLKHTIQKLGTVISSNSSTPNISKIRTETEYESVSLSNLSNFNESLLRSEEIRPKWLITIIQIYCSLQMIVNILQTKPKPETETSQKYSQSEFVNLTEESSHSKEYIIQEKMISNEETELKSLQRNNIETDSQMGVKEIFDDLSDVNAVNTKFDSTMPHYMKNINQNKMNESPKSVDDKKTKIVFEKANHKKYINFLEQSKYIKVKTKTNDKLLNHLNNVVLKEIQVLTESASDISQQNTNLHFRAAFALNHTQNLRERIAELTKNYMCSRKILHEKDVHLTNITTDISKLISCVNMFLELKETVQQDFIKKSINSSQDCEKLVTHLSTKKDELTQIESMINKNNNTIIPSIGKQIMKWKIAYQEAGKEIESFNNILYSMKKKKEQLKSEDTIIKRDTEAVTTKIVTLKDILRMKRQRYKKNTQELKRSCKDIKDQLERIIHAITLNDMCHARLKMTNTEDLYKHELMKLSTEHNKWRAHKHHTTVIVEKLKDSINLIYNELMFLKEVSNSCKCFISNEITSTKINHSTHKQGILFLQDKKDALKNSIKNIQEQVIGFQQSTECSAIIILIIQNNIKNMNSNINVCNKEKEKGMEMLKFRDPMAVLYVEKKRQEENRTRTFKFVRHMENVVIIEQFAYCINFTIPFCYYHFLVSLLYLTVAQIFCEV